MGLLLRLAMKDGASLARAGFPGDPLTATRALFEAILASPSGIVFAVDEWSDVLRVVSPPRTRRRTSRSRISWTLSRHCCPLPTRLRRIATLRSLSCSPPGRRRSFTANTIIRDPSWRKKGGTGALRIHPDDAADLGVASGESVRLTTRRGSVIVPIEASDSMLRGHVALRTGSVYAIRPTTETGRPESRLELASDRGPRSVRRNALAPSTSGKGRASRGRRRTRGVRLCVERGPGWWSL